MMDKFTEKNKFSSNAIIKVIGVGGGGGNALNTMIESGLTGVEFIAANTDVQALQANLAPVKIQLGKELTKGLGAGANPETGRNAALEDKAILQEVLSGADMVFVTGGMGGGTGTGAAPIIAQVARELGALTVGVVTKPFTFEGKRRRHQSDLGIQALRQSVDTLITIPNQRLLSIAPPEMSMLEGFKLADEVLLNAVKGISDIINIPGRVNVDFADVKTIMSEMGMALMGIGTASGNNRATEAARSAINSPLLEDIDVEGATGILINITGTSSMTLHEISEASTLIQEAAHEDANIIFGAVIDEAMGENIRVTVIATGFDQARLSYSEQPQFASNVTAQNQFQNMNQNYNQNSSPQTSRSQPNFNNSQQNQNQNNHYEARGTPSTPSMNNSSYASGNNSNNTIPQSPFVRNTTPNFTGRDANNFQQSHSGAQGRNPATEPQQPMNAYNKNSGGFNSTSNSMHSANQANNSPLNHSNNMWPGNNNNIYNTSNNQNAAPQNAEFENRWNEPQTTQQSNSNVTQNNSMNSNKSNHQNIENKIGGMAGYQHGNKFEDKDENTENALKLARELSDIEIDDTDFETPAFLRRKEDSFKSL